MEFLTWKNIHLYHGEIKLKNSNNYNVKNK